MGRPHFGGRQADRTHSPFGPSSHIFHESLGGNRKFTKNSRGPPRHDASNENSRFPNSRRDAPRQDASNGIHKFPNSSRGARHQDRTHNNNSNNGSRDRPSYHERKIDHHSPAKKVYLNHYQKSVLQRIARGKLHQHKRDVASLQRGPNNVDDLSFYQSFAIHGSREAGRCPWAGAAELDNDGDTRMSGTICEMCQRGTHHIPDCFLKSFFYLQSKLEYMTGELIMPNDGSRPKPRSVHFDDDVAMEEDDGL